MSVSDKVVYFDGVCNLCNALVTFVLRHEKHPVLKFASLQSEVGKRASLAAGLAPPELSTILFADGVEVLTKSDAIIAIASHLRPPYSWIGLFKVIPRPLRDWAYDVMAHHRYRWFRRKDACMIPPPAVQSRFIT